MQSAIAVHRVHLDVRNERGEHRERERHSSGNYGRLRNGRRSAAARILELLLVVDQHGGLLHEIRGRTELLRHDARDTLLV